MDILYLEVTQLNTPSIRVVLIEDDPMVQDINKQFVEKMDGFRVVGIASNGVVGINKLRDLRPDLVLLDMYMPMQDGLETISVIRDQFDVEVIVITAANDMHTIQQFLQHGALDYIIKPFRFERLKKALETYLELKQSVDEGRTVSQAELDEMLYGKNEEEKADKDKSEQGMSLPKGLNEITLKRIIQYLLEQAHSQSAEEVAEGVGIARVTARRYLEYLDSVGKVKLDIQYGGVGRPVNRYLINR